MNKIKKNRFIVICVLVVLFILISSTFLNQPVLEPKIEDAISLGHKYAYSLFLNHFYMFNKEEIPIVGKAKQKIENLDSDRILSQSEKYRLYLNLEKENVPYNLLSPLIADENDIKLAALARSGSSVSLGFVLYDFAVKIRDLYISSQLAEIPGKGEMTFYIEMHYEVVPDNRLRFTILNKLTELPIAHYLINYHGLTGRWVIDDHDYNYGINYYYDWLLEEGVKYSQEVEPLL